MPYADYEKQKEAMRKYIHTRRQKERQRQIYVETAISDLAQKSGLSSQPLSKNSAKPIDILQQFLFNQYRLSCFSTVLYLTPKDTPTKKDAQLTKAFEFFDQTLTFLSIQIQAPELLNKIEIAEKIAYEVEKYLDALDKLKSPQVRETESEIKKARVELFKLLPLWLSWLRDILRGAQGLEDSERYRRYQIILAFNKYFCMVPDVETVKALADMDMEMKREHDENVKKFEEYQRLIKSNEANKKEELKKHE